MGYIEEGNRDWSAGFENTTDTLTLGTDLRKIK